MASAITMVAIAIFYIAVTLTYRHPVILVAAILIVVLAAWACVR